MSVGLMTTTMCVTGQAAACNMQQLQISCGGCASSKFTVVSFAADMHLISQHYKINGSRPAPAKEITRGSGPRRTATQVPIPLKHITLQYNVHGWLCRAAPQPTEPSSLSDMSDCTCGTITKPASLS